MGEAEAAWRRRRRGRALASASRASSSSSSPLAGAVSAGTPEGLRPKQVALQARIVRERQLLLDIPGHGPVVWSLSIVRGLPGGPTTCEAGAGGGAVVAVTRGRMANAQSQPALLAMQILNTLTVLALVLLNWGMSFFVV